MKAQATKAAEDLSAKADDLTKDVKVKIRDATEEGGIRDPPNRGRGKGTPSPTRDHHPLMSFVNRILKSCS